MPLATFDKELNFLAYSEEWIKEFNIKKQDLRGKSCFDILPHLPDSLKNKLIDCLRDGAAHFNAGEQFQKADKSYYWLKWKINPLKNEDDEIDGLMILIEDITDSKREEEMLLEAQKVARIGSWKVDLIANKVYWTALTRQIHEVDDEYVPNFEDGIKFIKEEDRDKIIEVTKEATTVGTPWDIELRLIHSKRL